MIWLMLFSTPIMVNDLPIGTLTVFIDMVNDLLLLAPSIQSHDMVNDLLLLVQSIDCLHDMVNDLLLLAPSIDSLH